MSFFDNSMFKKLTSIGLIATSITGFAGCKKVEKNEVEEIPEQKVEVKYETNHEDIYNEALDKIGVELPNEAEEKDTSNNIEQIEDVHNSTQEESFISAITGTTERERLQNILSEKEWGETEEKALLEMYDVVEQNYDLREFHNPKDKQIYLRNLVNTINSITYIKIDPEDIVLARNNWNARADYYNEAIVLKFNNIVDIRHELAHLENGSFLMGRDGVDLGFVLEEGRASYIEADAMKNTRHIDNISYNINLNGNNEVIIDGCSGSYPVFEEVYKNFMALGIDMEAIRKESQSVDIYTKQIEEKLNGIYGNNLGTDYINSVNDYIRYFDSAGIIDIQYCNNTQDVLDAKQRMESIIEKCIIQNKNNQMGRESLIER